MCCLVCGIISRSVAAMGWSVRLISRFWLNGLCSLVVEFGEQLALWIALCVVIATVFLFGVKHFIPSMVEHVLRGLKPLLLLLQAPRGGNKPSLEVLLLQVFFRDDECVVVRAVLLSRDRLINFTLGIGVIWCRLRTMFTIPWLILLHRWVHGVVVSFGVDRGIILSCAVVVVFTVAGFRAAPSSLLWCLLEGIILRCIIAIAFFWCVHHIYII